MRTFLILATTLFYSSLCFAQNSIKGKWLTEDKEGIVEIYIENGKYFGKLIWLKKPNDDKGIPFTDSMNPDPKLNLRPLLNLVIISDMHLEDNEWGGGTIYDPETGKSYRCKLWLNDDKTLNVRGYIGILYETEKWVRVK